MWHTASAVSGHDPTALRPHREHEVHGWSRRRSGAASYTASKHTVVALSKALRLEAERHGVQVSVLCPGAIRTPARTGGRYGRINITGVSDEELLKF